MLFSISVFYLYRIRVFVYANCAIVIDPEHPNSCSKCSFPISASVPHALFMCFKFGGWSVELVTNTGCRTTTCTSQIWSCDHMPRDWFSKTNPSFLHMTLVRQHLSPKMFHCNGEL